MSQNLDKLRSDYEQALQHAQKLMADKDHVLAKTRDRYGNRLQAANDKAAAAQKQMLDAEAADALRDRPDGAAVAKALGLTLE